MTKRKYTYSHVVPLSSLHTQKRRPARLGRDVVWLTLIFFALAYGIVFCFYHGLVEFGTALSMTAVMFLWRIVIYDSRTVEEERRREYQQPMGEIRERPVTIERTSGRYFQMQYGRLDATQGQYQAFLANLLDHPQRRLTRRALPAGMLSDATAKYPEFCRELRRLQWVDGDNGLTEKGERVLSVLASGNSPSQS